MRPTLFCKNFFNFSTIGTLVTVLERSIDVEVIEAQTNFFLAGPVKLVCTQRALGVKTRKIGAVHLTRDCFLTCEVVGAV